MKAEGRAGVEVSGSAARVLSLCSFASHFSNSPFANHSFFLFFFF
jgi:hypothetical protein